MPTRAEPKPGSGPGRRALEHQGGVAQRHGDPEVSAVLAQALEAVDDAERDPLTHGIHAYPARMHHAIARHVLAVWGDPRMRVLDPFCGSGTVLVEARRLGLRSCGVDLNPLALRIAELKAAWVGPAERRRLQEAAAHVVEASFARVDRRERVRAPLSAAERQWYQPHVLLELAGLHAEIEALPQGFERRALEVVFSSIVVKFSRQRAETTERAVPKRLGKKVVTGFFARKSEELVQRLESLAEQAPRGGPPPGLLEGDARHLRALVGGWRFDLVLSSPPYGGTYDYVDHHARRYPWLGLSLQGLRRAELGARRNLSSSPKQGQGQGQGQARGRTESSREATERWAQEVEAMLRSIAGVLSERSRAVLLVGDAEVGGRRISAAKQLETLAERADLQVVASASQRRPDFRGGAPRHEHLVALDPRPRAAPHRSRP